DFYINDAATPAASLSAVSYAPFARIIFNNYNSGIAANDYSVVWTNFAVGNKVLGAPTGLASTASDGTTDITDGATNVNFVRNSWTPVDNAVSYNYEFRKPSSLPTYVRTGETNTAVQGQFHNASS